MTAPAELDATTTTVIWDADHTAHLTVPLTPDALPDTPPSNSTIAYRCDIATAPPGTPFFSSQSSSDTSTEVTWTFGPGMLQMFGTILCAHSPNLYDATATDQFGYAGAGQYRTYAQYTDINTNDPLGAAYPLQQGPLLIQFQRAPQPGEVPFTGNPNAGACGCGAFAPWNTAGAGGGGAGGGGGSTEYAVMVYGDQTIAGQKDFTEVPTVDGVPVTAVASVWFTGHGAPADPYPGADVNDYYLDADTGDVYQLGSNSLWTAQPGG